MAIGLAVTRVASQFGDEYLAAIWAKVMARGAKSFEHRYVLRERMTRQLTPARMLQAIDAEWFDAPIRLRISPEAKPSWPVVW